MIKLLVVDDHEGEGVFPSFAKGTAVNDFTLVDEESHWYSCEIEGHKTYVPDIFVTDGVLNRDYLPTELVVKKGQTLTLWAVVFEWLYACDENGRMGWLPSSKVISVS